MMTKMTSLKRQLLGTCATLLLTAQTGSAVTLPTYTAGVQGDAAAAHDGRLRWAVGVQNVQVVRSAPDSPSQTDGHTANYCHHPFITYWRGQFWVMHDGSGACVSWSTNGLDWKPGDSSTIFTASSHHRMGFYVVLNGRLLASHWIGTQRGAEGVRLVREIYGPNSYGPVYAIKTNYLGPGPYRDRPSYTSASDSGFKAACEELHNNRLFRQQWQEEDQDPNFYTVSRVNGINTWKAFSWYRLPDNRIVGTWKGVYQTVSTGSDWNPGNVPAPAKATTFGFSANAKTWGARTEDGRYAMVGCVPGGDLKRRWPLAVTTSTEGWTFDTPYLVIAGDIPVERYENANGDDKNAGPQYVRGISPGNGDPPGTDLWLTYSMNKEDIWVACVPVPIQGQVTHDVRDDFQNHEPGCLIQGWNTYSPQWAPVVIAVEGANRFLRIEDRDPWDYASVTRVFPQSTLARLAFQVRAHQTGPTGAPLEIDVVSSDGARAVAISLHPTSGEITAWNGGMQQTIRAYSTNEWISVELIVDGAARQYNLKVDGTNVLHDAAFRETASTVDRIVFRTGAFRLRDFDRRPHEDGMWLTNRIPNADVLQPTSRFDLDNVTLEKTMK
jgi:hypothetical protein